MTRNLILDSTQQCVERVTTSVTSGPHHTVPCHETESTNENARENLYIPVSLLGSVSCGVSQT